MLTNRWVALPFVTASSVISVGLFAYITNAATAVYVNRVLPDHVQNFIAHYSFQIFLICVAIFLFGWLWRVVKQFFIGASAINLSVDGALTLMEALNSIVDQKADRFGNDLRSMRAVGNLGDKSTVFSTITKPDQQIFCIVNALHSFLENIAPDIDFEVRLVEIEGGLAVNWYTFAPQNRAPQHEATEFQNSQSTIAVSLKKKKLVIIPDVQKESRKLTGRRYLMLDPEDKGSIVCAPVYHGPTQTTPYVLSVKANRPNFFSQAKSDYYEWLLDHFLLRIRLEHSLRELKSVN